MVRRQDREQQVGRALPAESLGYVDELVQVGLNQDPADTNESNGGGCERFFWAMQDANFNPPPPRLRRAGVPGVGNVLRLGRAVRRPTLD